MKHKRWSVFVFTALALVSLLLPAGVASATMFASNMSTGRHAASPPAWPARYFAPFVYVMPGPSSGSNPDQIVKAAQQTGVKYYILGLVIASGCQAIWGDSTKVGQPPPGSQTDPIKTAIDQLRSMGGDVSISFGGASGVELGQACTDVGALQQQYQSVVSAYQLTHVDFDLEGSAVADAAVPRRNQAIAALQKANPNLVISYTLPVLSTGLTSDGLNLLRDAMQKGVKISVVNGMAFDYGQPDNQMGADAISAGQALEKQVASINLSAKIGVTIMNGQADSAGEITTLDDARNLVKSADQDTNISVLSMWSLGRDQPCPGGSGGSASPTCSSINQQLYDFTKILGQFPDGTPPPLGSPAPQPSQQAQPSSTPTTQPPPPPPPPWSFPCSDTGQGQPSVQIISKDWLSGNTATGTSDQGGHFLYTYPADTYSLSQVHTLFSYAEIFAFLLMVPTIILLGYQIMLGASTFRHVGALEGLTRVLLGAMAVAVSSELVQMFIQMEGGMANAILLLHAQYPFPPPSANGVPVVYTLPGEPANSYRAIVVPMSRWGCAFNDFIGVFSTSFLTNTLASVIPLLGGLAHLAGHTITVANLIQDSGEVILTMLSVLLWGQVFLRILLINFYILAAPLVFGCWALPGGVGRNLLRLWCKGFITVLFVQIAQLFIATTLPLLLPTLPQIVSDKTGIMQDLLVQFPPILTLCLMLVMPRLLGSSTSKALGIAGSIAGETIVAVGVAASRV